MILHVVDVSNEHYERQMEVVYNTLRELEIGDKKVLTAFNKIDRMEAGDQTGFIRIPAVTKSYTFQPEKSPD